MNHQERWEKDNGDFTKIIDYPLNENSQVIDVGGYIGEWSTKIVSKYNPKLLLIEPVPDFYNFLKTKFLKNKNVLIDNSALSTKEKLIKMYVFHSQSSQYVKVSNSYVYCSAHTINYYMTKYNIDEIDLIQINIECEEYPLLLSWVESDILNKIKFLQVQFHTFCQNYEKEYKMISEGLKERGFRLRYRYDYVWESWENINKL